MDGVHSLRQQGKESLLPFPVSRGKAGAGGFPPRRKNGGSPRKRASPLAGSPKKTRDERFLLTEGGLLMEALIGSASATKVRMTNSSRCRDTSIRGLEGSRWWADGYRSSNGFWYFRGPG